MQSIVNGLSSGFVLALLAVAFQAVYLPSRVFFIGLAGVYTLTPFLALGARALGCGWSVSIATAVGGGVCISLLCEWFNHAPLTRKRASDGAQMISSLGLYMVVVQGVAIVWGPDTRSLRTGLDTVREHYGVSIAPSQWMALIVSVFLLSFFAAVLMRSNIGLRLRALADNPIQFALTGHNVTRYRLIAFGWAGALAAASSLVNAYDVGFDPFVGLHALLLAVVAVVIGGRGTFYGPVLGALLLGIVRSQVVWHWPGQWQEAATFGLLGLFLLFRPQGLVGRNILLEVSSS